MWAPRRSTPLPPGWERTRRRVLRASDICYICGRPGATEVDHIIPRSRGGGEGTNIKPVHKACHSRKTAAEGHARQREIRSRRARPEQRHSGVL